MSITTTKDSRLNIRCDDRARRLLNKAAAYAQASVSDFVLSHALASAAEVVQVNESITIKDIDFKAFIVVFDGPVGPSVALARAFDRHAEQVRQ